MLRSLSIKTTIHLIFKHHPFRNRLELLKPLRVLVERFARNLERDIRESPSDWLWLQKKWKIKRPAVAGAQETKPATASPRGSM